MNTLNETVWNNTTATKSDGRGRKRPNSPNVHYKLGKKDKLSCFFFFSDDLELHKSTTRMFPILKPSSQGGHHKILSGASLTCLKLLNKKENMCIGVQATACLSLCSSTTAENIIEGQQVNLLFTWFEKFILNGRV